jgi:hypothetical protein
MSTQSQRGIPQRKDFVVGYTSSGTSQNDFGDPVRGMFHTCATNIIFGAGIHVRSVFKDSREQALGEYPVLMRHIISICGTVRSKFLHLSKVALLGQSKGLRLRSACGGKG